MPDDARIREKAYAIWEREGRPDDRHEEHWARARREIEAESGAAAKRTAEPRTEETAAEAAPAKAKSGAAKASRKKSPAAEPEAKAAPVKEKSAKRADAPSGKKRKTPKD